MAGKAGYQIYVGNLPYSVDDQELIAIFYKYNPIEAKVILGPDSRSKGFGFVTVNTADDVVQACHEMDAMEYNGRRLKVSEAHKNNQSSRGGNSHHNRSSNRENEIDPEFGVDPNFGKGYNSRNAGSSKSRDHKIDPEFEVDPKYGTNGGRGSSDTDIDPEFDAESDLNQGRGLRGVDGSKYSDGRYY